jgi:phytoene dehydrogenase-like protein
VVGGGHNGLVAATLLARHGLRVVVVEASYSVGGLAGSGTLYGLTYDRYAYVIGLLDRSIASWLGIDLDSLVQSSEPSWVEVYEGEIYLRWWRDYDKLLSELESFGARKGFDELIKAVNEVWKCLERHGLVLTPLPPSGHEAAEVLDRCRKGLGWFFEAPVRRILSAYVPEELWASMVYPIFYDVSGFVLAYFMRYGNIWYQPRRSMASLSTAIALKLREAGGELLTGRRVNRILVESGRAVGVELDDGRQLRSRVVLYAASLTSLPSLLASSADALGRDGDRLKELAEMKHYVTRVDVYLKGRPKPPYEDGWKGIPLYASWSSSGGGEVTYPSLIRGEDGGIHLVQFSGVLFDYSPETLYSIVPGVEGCEIVDVVVRDWSSQVRYGNPSGDPNHIPMTNDHLFDRRPLPGWHHYRTPVPCLYHGSASSYPGGQVTGIPGFNAALRILLDLGVRLAEGPVPRKLVEQRALEETEPPWTARESCLA